MIQFFLENSGFKTKKISTFFAICFHSEQTNGKRHGRFSQEKISVRNQWCKSGIGKEIAKQLAAKVENGSVFLLTARNMALLQSTATEISNKVQADCFAAELENLQDNGSMKSFEESLKAQITKNGPFEAAIIFHNAGSLGDNSKKASEFFDSAEIRRYLDVNVVSMILLNNVFLKQTQNIQCRSVINITSLLAVQGVPSYAIYGTGNVDYAILMRNCNANVEFFQ